MFSLIASNLRLIGIGAAVIACLSLAYVVNGWRDDSKALAVERAQYRQAVDGFNEQLRQVQLNEQIAREASRGYQAQLLTAQSAADRLRADNRGLQITARRAIPPVTVTTFRLDNPTPVIERDQQYAIDPERLTRLAESCQADAEQLSALIGWATRTGR
jgi:hypothetical protein